MATFGVFDSELRYTSWVADEAVPVGWFDGDLIDVDHATAPYQAIPSASSTATASLTTQKRFAATPASVSTVTGASLTTSKLLGTASGAAVSTVTATITVPLWQRVGDGSYATDIIKLSDTLFYSREQDSVGVLSGGSMTWYPQSGYPNGREYPGVCALTETTLLGYGGYADSNNDSCVAEAFVGTISGTTLSWAAATEGPISKSGPNLIKLADGRILIANGGNPPTDSNFSYDAMFATVSGTTITYSSYLESNGCWWHSWQDSVVLSDGRILSLTPYEDGSSDHKPQFELSTVSGNTFSSVTSTSNLVRTGATTGWFGVGLCILGDGRILCGGGYWHDGSNWQSDPNIYEVSVSGNVVTVEYLTDLPYSIPAGECHGTSLLPIGMSKVYVNPGNTWTLGEFTRSLVASGAALESSVSASVTVGASLTTGAGGAISASVSATPTATATLRVGAGLFSSVSATPSASVALTTIPAWTDLGGAGEYAAYGVLNFDTTHFYDIYQKKLGVLSGDVMTWYSVDVPSTTYVSGQAFCVIDATHIFCSGGTNSGDTAGTDQCWVGTLSGNAITWASAGTLGATRSNHSATLLGDGRILINGGYDYAQNTARPNSEFLTLSSYYVSLNNIWVNALASNKGITKRPVLLSDGRIMWANGQAGTNQLGFSFLTISGNTFSKEDVFLSYNFGAYSGIYSAALIRQSNGRILFGGGYWNDGSTYPPVSNIYELYVSGSDVTKSLSPVASVPVVESGGTASYFAEGPSNATIYVSGGSTYGQYRRVLPAAQGPGAALQGALTTLGNSIAPLTTAIRLVASLSSATATTAAIRVGVTVSATASSAPSASAALTIGAGLYSASTGVSVTNATLTTSVRLAASSLAQQTITTALDTGIPLASIVGAAASTTASVTASIRLAATASLSASAAVSVSSAIRMAASPSGSSSATSALTTSVRLGSSAVAVSTANAAAATGIRLAASAYSVATRIAADLSAPGAAALLVATPSASTIVSAPLTTQISLSGSVSSAASATASLSAQIRLAAATSGTPSTTGSISTQIRLAATSSATPSAVAGLPSAIHALSASPSSSCTSSPSLTTKVNLVGSVTTTSATSASITTIIRLSGSISSIEVANGVLTAQIQLAASPSLTQRIDAQLAGTIAAAALTAENYSSADTLATLTTSIDLRGSGYVAVSASGEVSTGVRLSGVLSVTSLASGRLKMHSLASGKNILLVEDSRVVFTAIEGIDIISQPQRRSGTKFIAA